MATGTILSLHDKDANGSYGQVKQDETEDVYDIKSSNTDPSLKSDDRCTFDIETADDGSFYADDLKPISQTPPPQSYEVRKDETKDYTLNSGDTLTVYDGATLTGTITNNGGKVVILGTQKGDSTTSTSNGIFVIKGGGKVKGTVTVGNGGNLKIVGGGTVKAGSIKINQANRVIIGNNNPTPGGPASVATSLSLNGVRKLTIDPNSSLSCG